MRNQINKLLPLTNYIIVQAATNNIIILPYEIFEIPTMRLSDGKATVSEIPKYFQKLASCNKQYTDIILSRSPKGT